MDVRQAAEALVVNGHLQAEHGVLVVRDGFVERLEAFPVEDKAGRHNHEPEDHR